MSVLYNVIVYMSFHIISYHVIPSDLAVSSYSCNAIFIASHCSCMSLSDILTISCHFIIIFTSCCVISVSYCQSFSYHFTSFYFSCHATSSSWSIIFMLCQAHHSMSFPHHAKSSLTLSPCCF